MSQLSYSNTQAAFFAGMKADARFDEVESKKAEVAIPFGRGLCAESGDVDVVRLPKKDVAVLVFAGDFVASNTIDLKVNGTAIAQVTFATDHATTAGLLVAAIAALTGIDCSLVASDATNRTLRIESDGSTVAVTDIVVAAGASQTTGSVTYSADDIFRGISLHTHNELGSYAINEMVSVGRKVVAIVETSAAVSADEAAYIDLAGGIGKFTNVATNNMATGGYFCSTVGAAGLAAVQINMP